jgi:isopenicillin-N epimerase
LKYVGSLVPGGWPQVMQRNHALAVSARSIICNALEVESPCPENMIGSLASIPIVDSRAAKPSSSPLYLDPLQERLLKKFNIEVPIIPWPAWPKRLLRISAQLYNSLPQYEKLAEVL